MKLCILVAVSCCLVLSGQAVYVYDRPVGPPLRHDLTVAENYGQVLGKYADAADDDDDDEASAPDHNDVTPADIEDADPGKNKGKGKGMMKCATSQCFCGTPNVNRIVGGTQVRTNKYPWTAQLIKGRYYGRLFCGGSLINDRYVLTAAHCVHRNRDAISVRFLQLDRSSREQGITRKVLQTMVHSGYNPNSITNDVALLKLDAPVPFGTNMRPVCLPNVNHNFDGKNAIVAGWGLVKEGGVTSNYLQEATVPIITNQQCRSTRYKNKIVEVMLCAGLVKSGGKDACQGDSGGPLIVNEGRFKLAGVVSFGYGCAQPNAPGVYTRVSKFLKWIKENTADACYCSS